MLVDTPRRYFVLRPSLLNDRNKTHIIWGVYMGGVFYMEFQESPLYRSRDTADTVLCCACIVPVGKWSCVEIFGLWKWLLATLHKLALRCKVWYNCCKKWKWPW